MRDLRDRFAEQALATLLTEYVRRGEPWTLKGLADDAYKLADAMMAARGQSSRAADPSLPDRCRGIAQCGLQDDEAQLSRRSFSDPLAWNCKGCGFEHRTVTTT